MAYTSTRTDRETGEQYEVISYDCTETAGFIRKALKALYPQVKFSVRISRFSGGSSIDVRWTDGPGMDRVRAITNRFQTIGFDGMTDSTTYSQTEHAGQMAQFNAYVSERREYSAEFYTRGVVDVCEKYGMPQPRILVSDGHPYLDPSDSLKHATVPGYVGRFPYLSDVIEEHLHNLSA